MKLRITGNGVPPWGTIEIIDLDTCKPISCKAVSIDMRVNELPVVTLELAPLEGPELDLTLDSATVEIVPGPLSEDAKRQIGEQFEKAYTGAEPALQIKPLNEPACVVPSHVRRLLAALTTAASLDPGAFRYLIESHCPVNDALAEADLPMTGRFSRYGTPDARRAAGSIPALWRSPGGSF